MVERYDHWRHAYLVGEPAKDGKWVSYEDYQKLDKECDKWASRVAELEQQVAELLEAAGEAVEAERLNRNTTRNYLKRKPRHKRFEDAIEALAKTREVE